MSDFERMRASIDVATACARASRPDLVEDAILLIWNDRRADAIQFVAAAINGIDTEAAPPLASAAPSLEAQLREAAARRFGGETGPAPTAPASGSQPPPAVGRRPADRRD
jgi:hypothetical protein